jgi:hypothetical protein
VRRLHQCHRCKRQKQCRKHHIQGRVRALPFPRSKRRNRRRRRTLVHPPLRHGVDTDANRKKKREEWIAITHTAPSFRRRARRVWSEGRGR